MSAKNGSPDPATAPLRAQLGTSARILIKEPLELWQLCLRVLFQPGQVGAELNDSAISTARTAKHFLEMYAVSFLIFVLADRLHLVSGESEWRILITTLAQVIFGTAIIYVLSLTISDRPPILIIVQAALLFVGVYLLVSAAISIPIKYAELAIALPNLNRETDIFGTEYERCLADHSRLYWLLRGDLEFFLYSDRWKPQDWGNWLFDNYRYFLVLPFLLVFASLMRVQRRMSFWLMCLFTFVAFVVTVELFDGGKRAASRALARATPECSKIYLERVVQKYSPDHIAKQVVYKINNEAMKSDGFKIPIFLDGRDFVIATQIKPNVTIDWKIAATIPGVYRESYCSNYDFWAIARRIEYNLLIAMYNADRTPIHRQRVTPKDCKSQQ